MKKEKISLSDLKLKSYVTSIEDEELRKVRGGGTDIGMCGIPGYSDVTCNVINCDTHAACGSTTTQCT